MSVRRGLLAGGRVRYANMQDDTREQFHLLHEAMEMTNKALEELHASLKDAREAKGDVHQTIADAKDNVHQKLADAKAALERAKEDLKKHV
jgi:hypothetical protein